MAMREKGEFFSLHALKYTRILDRAEKNRAHLDDLRYYQGRRLRNPDDNAPKAGTQGNAAEGAEGDEHVLTE